MRFLKIAGISLLGFGILVAGFVYDGLFAGIPYPDPTPELQARYDFHSSIAGYFYMTGLAVFVAGLLASPFIWKRTKPK